MTTFSEVRFFKWQDSDKSVSLRAKSGSYGGFRSVGSFGDTCGALCADDYKGINSQYVGQGKLVMTDEYIVGNGQVAQLRLQEKARTLDCMHEQQILLQRGENKMDDKCWLVRRLTPLECTRLQGFPDGWVDIGEWVDEKGKLHKEADAPKYKALGNSIALPFWYWLLKNISAQYPDRKPTMASLFDGIGGFPLCWQWINGDGTCVWSSEIEPFPIAVTEKHFGENGDWQNYEKPDWYKKWESNT